MHKIFLFLIIPATLFANQPADFDYIDIEPNPINAEEIQRQEEEDALFARLNELQKEQEGLEEDREFLNEALAGSSDFHQFSGMSFSIENRFAEIIAEIDALWVKINQLSEQA